ncbi:hypothetical protein [Microvirga pudoricolor]|uniref:hypothetical protein n=1 Tax=Microvirga pudoricolor TaxID=2778729 RepID=UPI001950CD21|nr:hypothetical protein [Microvirga pudoricolor]MBM6594328.1 hypothetical protein [Microvirga pudoricolor]
MAGVTGFSRELRSTPILVRLALIGLGLVVNLAFVAMVLNPRVSPEYRDYYITKASQVWPKGAYPVLRTGDVLYAKGAPAPPTVVGTGWSSPNPDGLWSERPSAHLMARLPPDTGGARLVLTGAPFLWPGRTEQVADILVNGRPAGSLRLTSLAEGDYPIDLPAERIRERDGYVNVELRFRDLRSPSSLGMANDFRLLGVRMTGLRLEAR